VAIVLQEVYVLSGIIHLKRFGLAFLTKKEYCDAVKESLDAITPPFLHWHWQGFIENAKSIG